MSDGIYISGAFMGSGNGLEVTSAMESLMPSKLIEKIILLKADPEFEVIIGFEDSGAILTPKYWWTEEYTLAIVVPYKGEHSRFVMPVDPIWRQFHANKSGIEVGEPGRARAHPLFDPSTSRYCHVMFSKNHVQHWQNWRNSKHGTD